MDEVSRERETANPVTGGVVGEKQNLRQMDDFLKECFIHATSPSTIVQDIYVV